MAFTYTWAITGLKKKDQVNTEGETLPGAIIQTYWKITGTDADGNVGEFAGATPLTAENVPAGDFTAFESLTEEQVLGWIRNIVENDPTYMEHINGRLQYQIDQEIEEEVTEMPWGGEPTTPLAGEAGEPLDGADA